MKQFLKSTISLILTLLISLLFSANAFAYEYGSFEIESMIKIEKDGLKEIRSINSKDINRIRDSKSLMYKKIGDTEKLNLIFQALGYKMNPQQLEKVSEKLSLSEIGNIHTEKAYIEVDENGEQKNISKDEALKASELKNKALAELTFNEYQHVMTMSDTSPTTGHGNEEPIVDSENYMAQTIFVIYTPNYNGKGTTPGRYFVMAAFEWLTTPLIHGTDCMGLFTDQFNWVDRAPGDDSNYYFISSYHQILYDEQGNIVYSEDKGDFLYEDDAIISNKGGFCFEYNLKSNFFLIRNNEFKFMIFGICRVKNYNNPDQSLSISSEYVHTLNSATIGLSFSIGPLGIDVSGFLPGDISYSGSHEWDYKKDFNA